MPFRCLFVRMSQLEDNGFDAMRPANLDPNRKTFARESARNRYRG